MSTNYFSDFSGLETERLIIRNIQVSDARDIFEFTSNRITSEFLSWNPHTSIEHTSNFVHGIVTKYSSNAPSQWSIELKQEKKVIGIAGFITYFPEHRKGELAFVLSPGYWRNAYMTEALEAIINHGFEKMNLIRIEAKCEIDNFASERVLQKVGMHFEGCSYNYLMRKAKLRHYKFYAILK